jgi:hypothetical protein
VYCTLYCTFAVYFLSRTYESKGFWRFNVGTGTKEDESSTGCVWVAAFHHVTARSRLARVLKLMNRLFYFPIFFSGRGKPRILNQWIRGHDCNWLPWQLCFQNLVWVANNARERKKATLWSDEVGFSNVLELSSLTAVNKCVTLHKIQRRPASWSGGQSFWLLIMRFRPGQAIV